MAKILSLPKYLKKVTFFSLNFTASASASSLTKMNSRRLVPFSPDWSLSSLRWPEYDPWTTWTTRNTRLTGVSPLTSLSQLNRHLSIDGTDAVAATGDSFEISLDVNGYDPQELQINLVNRCLTITGNHESKSPDGNVCVKKQFTRSYQLPSNVDVEKMKSLLSTENSTLRIEAPFLKIEEQKRDEQPKEIPLPINRNTSSSIEAEKK